MKYSFFMFLVIFIAGNVVAQDTIIKHDGEKITAKIVEITPKEIKYKKFNFQEGPLYSELKSEIEVINFSNGLKEYFENQPQQGNHRTDIINRFNPTDFTDKIDIRGGGKYSYKDRGIGFRQVQSVLENTQNSKIIDLVSKSKHSLKLSNVGFGFFPFAIASIALFSESQTKTYNANQPSNQYAYTSNPNEKLFQSLGTLCGLVAIACPITFFVQIHNSIKYNTEAVLLYNQRY